MKTVTADDVRAPATSQEEENVPRLPTRRLDDAGMSPSSYPIHHQAGQTQRRNRDAFQRLTGGVLLNYKKPDQFPSEY